MRDAFGGTFMLKLFIIFIVVYITFMTIAVVYARTFRIKNTVINILELQQVTYDARWNDLSRQISATDSTTVLQYIDDTVGGFGYSYGNDDDIKSKCSGYKSDGNNLYTDNGICISPYFVYDGSDVIGVYYNVTAYLVIRMPLFNVNMAMPITSSTEVIYYY